MNPKCIRLHTMREALESPELFANLLEGESWDAWRVILIASQGEPLITDEERALFTELTGRETSPTEPCDELWGVVGRRGGKTRAFAVLASYLAGCIDYEAVRGPGERLKLPVLAATTKQATKAFNYILGIFEGSPELQTLLVNKARDGEPPRYDVTQDTIRLCTEVDIEVVPANFRTVRGETLIGAICDEVAYWQIEGSANPDVEILDAVRNGMGTTGGQLAVLTSPYARKGEVYVTYKAHFGAQGDPLIIVLQAASLKMNPSLSPRVVERAYERDPAKASAEYGAEFRKDVEAFVTIEAVQACMPDDGRYEIGRQDRTRYTAFVDPSGGGADSMTMAIAHREGDIAVLDAVREEMPGANPDVVVEGFCALLKTYGIREVTGDAYAGAWVPERFKQHGVTYKKSERSKSDIYRDFLPVLNSRRVRLLNVPKLEKQLVSLERRTSRGTGKDIIDHPQQKSAHDDVANAVAGVIVHVESKPRPMVISDKLLTWSAQRGPNTGMFGNRYRNR